MMPSMHCNGNVGQIKETKKRHGNDHTGKLGAICDTSKIWNLPDAETLKCMVAATEESGFQIHDKIRAMGSTSCASSNMISNQVNHYLQENIQVNLNGVGPHNTGWANSCADTFVPQKRMKLTGTEALKDMILSMSSAHSKDFSDNLNMVNTSNNLAMNTSNRNALRNSLELLLGNHLLPSNSSSNDIRISDFNEHAFQSSLGYDSSAIVGADVLKYQMLSNFNQGSIARTEMAQDTSDVKEVKKRENNRRNAARSRVRSKEFVDRLKITVAKLTEKTMVLQHENNALRMKISVLEKELHDKDAANDNVQADGGSEVHSESKNLNEESTVKAHIIQSDGSSESQSTSKNFNEENTVKTEETTKRSIGKETICANAFEQSFDAEYTVKSPPTQVTVLSEVCKISGSETRSSPGSGIFDSNTCLLLSDSGKNISHSVDKEIVSNKNPYLVNGESYVKKPSQKQKNNEMVDSTNEVLVSEKAQVRMNNATPLLPIKNSVVSSYLRKRNLEQDAPNAKKRSVTTEKGQERSTSTSLDTSKLNNPGQFCNNNMLSSTFNHILGLPNVDQTAMFHQLIQLSNQIPSGENLKGCSSSTGAGLISPFIKNNSTSQSLLSKEIDLYKESLTRQVLQYSNPLGQMVPSNTAMNSVDPNFLVSPHNSLQATNNVPLLDSSFINHDLTRRGEIFHSQPFASQNQRYQLTQWQSETSIQDQISNGIDQPQQNYKQPNLEQDRVYQDTVILAKEALNRIIHQQQKKQYN